MRSISSEADDVVVLGAFREHERRMHRRAVVLAAYAALGPRYDASSDPGVESDLQSVGDEESTQVLYVKARALARRAQGDARAVGVAADLPVLFADASRALALGRTPWQVELLLQMRAFAPVVEHLLGGALVSGEEQRELLRGSLSWLSTTPTGRLLLVEAASVRTRAALFELRQDPSLPSGRGATTVRHSGRRPELVVQVPDLGDPIALARELLRAVAAARQSFDPADGKSLGDLEELLMLELWRLRAERLADLQAAPVQAQ